MTDITLKPFVTSEVCLTCDGCCRFKEPETIWRPKLTDEEAAQMKERGLYQTILSDESWDEGQFIKTKPGCGEHLCQFFNPQDHACGIYAARPFECALYPYVISRVENRVLLYVHLNCPFVQEQFTKPKYQAYNQYLKEFFKRDDVLAFLRRNLRHLNDYSMYRDELELIGPVEGV